MINIIYKNKIFVCEDEKGSSWLISKNYGQRKDKEIYILNLYETLYLLDNGKINLIDNRHKVISKSNILKKTKVNYNNYLIYADLRKKGHKPYCGLKFGALFRVYEKGAEIGKTHAKWLVEPIINKTKLSVTEVLSKNRIANTTNKKLLFAFVDYDNSIIYIENKWCKL